MKRNVLIGMLILLLCVIFMSGCSKQEHEPAQALTPSQVQDKQSDAASIAVLVASGRYGTDYFSSNRLSIVLSATAEDEAAYLWGYHFKNDEKTGWLVKYSADGTSAEYPLPLSDGGYITALDAAAGEAWYLERIDDEDGSAEWLFHTLNAEERLDWATESNDLQNLTIAGNTAYLSDAETLYICSLPDGALINTVTAQAYISTILRSRDGNAVIYCEETGTLYTLDDNGQELTKAAELPLLFQNSTLISGTNSDYDCLVITQTALFGWNVGAQSATQLLSFDTCGLSADHISAFACVADGRYLGAVWRSGESEDRLFRLELSTDSDDAVEEITLKIAGLSRPMVLSSAISDFKALHPEYTVEYTDYAELYGEQALQQLQIDLVQGNAPDLLFVNGMPFEAYANRGLLENLYEWIEADDSVSRDDFTQNLLCQLETSDHHLYQIPQSYSIVTTAGTQEIAGSRTEWSYAAINDALERSETLLSAFYAEPRESLTLTLPLYMIHTLVDYETAESHFDSDEAVAFLTFLNRVQPHATLSYRAESELEALRNGEILFAQLMILSPELFAGTDALFDGTLLYPGYPNAAGGSFYLNLPMSIPATATEKTGAWAFMKMMFSSSYYATRGGWIPLQSGFEASMQDALTNGVSEQSIRKLEAIQKNICSLAYYDETISDILSDETSYMFAGEKTAEQTAEQINRRVQLYLDEQNG